MHRILSAIRRSLNGETKQNISQTNSANKNQMKRTGDEIDRDKNFEHPDADSEDGFYEVLQNLFPSSPYSIYCSNSPENPSFQPQMADSGEPSSPPETVEFFSGTEESENPVDTSLEKETSSKEIQCCSVKSVGVQCDSITYVSKGVQWEPLLMESQSVQCMSLDQVAKEVQTFNTYKSQCEPNETVSLVTTGVQYEYPYAEEESCEKQSYTSKQLSVNVPFEETESVDSESVTQLSETENRRVLAEPSVQSELVVVNSSQLSECVDSYASHGSDVNVPEEEHEVELYSSSQSVPSTSGVNCKRKRKCSNRVRKMKHSRKTSMHSRNERTKEKYSSKRLPLEARTDRNRSMSEGVNNDSDELEGEGVEEKEANNVTKAISSVSKEASTFGKNGEKLVVEETPEELLAQMGNNENCLAKEDLSNKEDGVPKRVTKVKLQQIASQKIMNLSGSQSEATRSSEKSGVEESSEEILKPMGNDQNLAKEDTSSNSDAASESLMNGYQQNSASQKIISATSQQSHSTSLVAATSDSQRTGGLNWFSSLACERTSSPEILGEDMFEELKEDRSDCNKNLAQSVQSKNSDIIDKGLSFHNIQHSTPTKQTSTARKSLVQNLKNDSHKTSAKKRKKLAFEANNTGTSASSKQSAPLVPYSNSDSDSDPGSTCADNFSETNKGVFKKNLKKKQQHSKSTLINNKFQKTGIIPSDPWKQKTRKGINCDRVSKSHLESSQSNSKSVLEKNVVMSTSKSDNESENSIESDMVSRIKIRRVQRKKNYSEKNAVMSISNSESSESENSGESDIVPRKNIKRVQRKSSYSEKKTIIFSSNSDGENSRESDITSRSKRRVQENKEYISTQQNPGSRTKSGNVSIHSTQVGNKHFTQRDPINSSPVHTSKWSSDEDEGSKVSRVSCGSTTSKGLSRRGAWYMKEEREAILWYIIDHKYFRRVKGRALWQSMEKEQVCINRTWQSMKEHFLKKILPQIESYHLNPEITKKFLHVRK
ncbi:hypothetical protein R5R35_007173 [Gryllus longicercus]|uniref:TERF2-interacting telomeric protein 1 Myb domain-containing protein n=1 Tax=Gryllus longicercus TaxID=2509291 RepID=A0AAN9Z1C3_9ORTH